VKPKLTFFNSRKGRIYQDHIDTNNYLFTIFFNEGAELSFILRDLKKNDKVVNYIYKKLHSRFGNIAEIETSKISSVEYNLMKLINVPSVIKLC
jgi:hypothetical protein